MKWERHGKTSYPMHSGHTGQHTRPQLECPHTNWCTGRLVTYLLNYIAGDHRRMQLSELEEWREKAYHNSKIYKERVKRWHDKRIKKEFAPGDKVLLFNSRVKLLGHGKLWSKWEGPFKVINSSSHRAITLQNDEGTLFKVNGQRLKLFLEPNKELDEIDVIHFYLPMDI